MYQPGMGQFLALDSFEEQSVISSAIWVMNFLSIRTITRRTGGFWLVRSRLIVILIIQNISGIAGGSEVLTWFGL